LNLFSEQGGLQTVRYAYALSQAIIRCTPGSPFYFGARRNTIALSNALYSLEPNARRAESEALHGSETET
jgi:hypothetical protein